MLFKIKPKKVTLDFFTSSERVYQTSAPYHGVKKLPTWWKTLPKAPAVNVQQNNMRTCPGFVDLYLKSVVLPMWCEARVVVGPIGQIDNWNVQMPDEIFMAEAHPSHQFNNVFDEALFQQIKFINPWKLKANTDTTFLLHDAHWERCSQPNYFMVPGVTAYRLQNALEINMFFNKGEKENVTHFRLGEPIAYITPMADVEFSVKHHLISKAEFSQMTPAVVAFRDSLRKTIARAKEQERG